MLYICLATNLFHNYKNIEGRVRGYKIEDADIFVGSNKDGQLG